jgi:hypothetical protein
MEQAQLETWSGAPPRPAPPAQSNEYLLSAFGNIERGEVYTIARSWLVLAASGVVLAAGLLLIYLPGGRRPAAILAAGLLLAASGAVFPEPAWLVAQAAGLGVVLALVAALLAGGVTRSPAAALPRSPRPVGESSAALSRTQAAAPALVGSTSRHQLPLPAAAPLSAPSSPAAPSSAPLLPVPPSPAPPDPAP